MNAKDKLLEYARKHNKAFMEQTLTDEQFVGKMVMEGITIARAPGSMTVANARREDKVIIVSETVKSEKHEIVNGKLISTPVEETKEVFRVDV